MREVLKYCGKRNQISFFISVTKINARESFIWVGFALAGFLRISILLEIFFGYDKFFGRFIFFRKLRTLLVL